MANLDPHDIEAALQIYARLINGAPLNELTRLPTFKRISAVIGDLTPENVEDAVKRAAQRVDRFDEISTQFQKLHQARLDDTVKKLPQSEGVPDPFSRPQATEEGRRIEALVQKESARLKEVKRGYEPIPSGSDPRGMFEGVGRAFLESSALYATMKAQNIGLSAALDSTKFKAYQKDLNGHLKQDLAALDNNPMFQRFKQDYPLGSDVLTVGFTGPVIGPAVIGLRETLVHAMIAADDPDVRRHFANFARMEGGPAHEEFSSGMDAAYKRIEKAYFSQEVKQRRWPIDIVASMALTSPSFLKMVGLPTNLPQNLVWKGLKGIKSEAMSLYEATDNQVYRHVIDYFRDRRTVRAEHFTESVFEKIQQTLGGGEAAKEATAAIRAKVEADLGTLAGNMAKREEIARNIFLSIYDGVQAHVIGMTPEEKTAVIYGIQNRPDLLDEGLRPLLQTPRVETAVLKMRDTLSQIAAAEQLPARSNYYPAYQFLAEEAYAPFRKMIQDAREITRETMGKIISKAAAEPYKKKREVIDVVHATPGSIDSRIDDFIFDVAAPYLNKITTGVANDARTIASVVMDNLKDTLDNPDRFRVISEALAENPFPKPSATKRAISAWVNGAFLTRRLGAWTMADSLDSIFSTAANVLTRAKGDSAISLSELFKRTPLPPEIVGDNLASPMAYESTHPWRFIAWMENFNSWAFKANKMVDTFRSSALYKFNYGSELATLARDAGVEVAALGEPAINVAKQRALDATKKFGLAFSFNSAFTTSTPSAILFPYLGFFTKAAGRFAETFGEVPELYKAGAFALQKVRENNAEWPEEWQKESTAIYGHMTNFPRKLVYYPIFKTLADSNYGELRNSSREAELESKAQNLDGVTDPNLRAQVLQENPELQDYLQHRSFKAVGSFLQAMTDIQALPIGPGISYGLKATGLLQQRTPHIIPGGREFSNALYALGLEKLDPEGAIFPKVKAFNQAQYDADVAVQHIILEKNKKGEFAPGEWLNSINQARDIVRGRRLSDFFWNSAVGLGRSVTPEEQELYNNLQKLRNRFDLIVPSDKELAAVREKTGISNTQIADMIWRESYLRTFGYADTAREDRLSILNQHPELRPLEKVYMSKREKLALEDVRDHYDALRQIPPDQQGAYMKTDRLFQAFVRSYKGQIKFDEDGNGAFELHFDGNDQVGPTLWNWMNLTPEQRISKFSEHTPDNSIIQQFWPQEFDRLTFQAPTPPDPLLKRNDQDRTLLQLAPQSVEEKRRAEKNGLFSDWLKNFHSEDPNAFPDQVLEKGKLLYDKAIEGGKGLWEHIKGALNQPLIPSAEAAEGNYYGTSSEKIRTFTEQLYNPKTPEERQAVEMYKERVKSLSKYNLTTTDGWNKAAAEFRVNFQPYPAMVGMLQSDKDYHVLFDKIGGPMIVQGGQNKFSDDIRGLAVGESVSSEYQALKQELLAGLVDGNQDPKFYSGMKKKMQGLGEEGKTYWDALRYGWPTMTDEVDLRVKGYKYQMGFYRLPRFEQGQEAVRSTYFDQFFSKPGETRLQYEARVKEAIPKMDATQYQRLYDFVGDRSAVPDALAKLRGQQYTTIPLTKELSRDLDSAKDYILANQDDVPAVYNYVQQNPDTTELLRRYDPRTYRTVENKLFSATDTSYLNYMKGSGFDPESVDYARRHAPNSFNRLFYKNPEFRAVAIRLGMQPTQPDGATDVTKEYFNPQTGKIEQVQVASVLATPEPIAPDAIPDGIFGNFANTINYVERRARRQASTLRYIASTSPENLSPADRTFLAASPEAQVFQAFPGVIGQAFREGKLSPNDVISQLKGLTDYGGVTGALDPSSYQRFSEFLNSTSTVFGAANFGFRIGQFLDDTFNTPRLPINNKAVDFLLAGGPVSGGAPLLPREKINLISPIDPALTGSNNFNPNVPQFNNLGPGTQPGGAGEARANKTAAGAQVAGAGSAASIGLPPLAAVLALVSAGFTVANLVQSRRARKNLAEQSKRAETERQAQIQAAINEQRTSAEESLQRQLADQRLRQFQQERKQQEQDFAQRSHDFLRDGASFASFAQQPKEFQSRFADRFGPELLQFSRRPQYQSRLNLIESVQGRIPKARY